MGGRGREKKGEGRSKKELVLVEMPKKHYEGWGVGGSVIQFSIHCSMAQQWNFPCHLLAGRNLPHAAASCA